MKQTGPSPEDQIAEFIASAAKQPLLDAAFELWRWRYRLDSIEGLIFHSALEHLKVGNAGRIADCPIYFGIEAQSTGVPSGRFASKDHDIGEITVANARDSRERLVGFG